MTAKDAFIGAAIERIEDLRLLAGNGRYVDDIHRNGMLHLVVVRSEVAHGLVKNIVTAEARKMPAKLKLRYMGGIYYLLIYSLKV